MHRSIVTFLGALASAVFVASSGNALARDPVPDKCGKNDKKLQDTLKPGTGKDLYVTGNCVVPAGTFQYGEVNIYDGGTLTFTDAKIHFYAKSILIENTGALIAGSPGAPIGTTPGASLTIHLYGEDQGANPGGQGTTCITDVRCGVPEAVWNSNGSAKVALPGVPDDYFYQYGPLTYDGAGTQIGYFGYKVIGLSYGGTLQLFGRKGATYASVDVSNSGTSWVRLAGTVLPTKNVLVVDRDVDWAQGDKIVLTTTDYLPGHSEELTIQSIGADKRTITTVETFKYRHQGEQFDLPADTARLKLNFSKVETRAAVALLTRSIRIVSEGKTLDAGDPDGPGTFPPTAGNYFGGHTIVRQGFKSLQVQGVEFRNLGQGGRIGHYPVHFHMARTTPPSTFVKDSSVNESMTRWFVVHSTHGVTFARNVGWKSIGHGFYIEDGTETDNKFQTNIGIYARAAIDNAAVNPRKVPGILAAPLDPTRTERVPFQSDIDHPSVFWIMNGWNDFEYNLAAGAGMCGACYWLVPGANSGHSRHMKFDGYASLQANSDLTQPLARAAMTPLRKFVGNSCTSAMNSFNTIGNTTACYGAGFEAPFVASVPNALVPPACDQSNPKNKDGTWVAGACALDAESDNYYPKVDQGGGRFATICNGGDCSTTPRCDTSALDKCMITSIDRYTSSFHWTETNFAAIWLRPQWYLLSNSVLTDVQNGGLTFVTGGGYTDADVVRGHWALVRKTVFIGATQDPKDANASAFAAPEGPFNAKGLPTGANCNGNHCLAADEGVSFPISNFGMNQRMFNIYDGPAYQESNAYLKILKQPITDCTLASPTAPAQVCDSAVLAGKALGLPWDPVDKRCYMPNAAIGWKQPNGFYYPPAFHSANLYFSEVDIRHYVIEPLFVEGTYTTDVKKARLAYCNWNDALFTGFTDVDRQTELSDDDGSLTGYAKTVSVNLDSFFNAPVEAIECASDNTAKTSPYDYVTSVVYPKCASDGNCPGTWNSECTNQFCYGVPLYRQLLVNNEHSTGVIKMAGQDTFQRSTLTPNNGVFFIDTSVSEAKQRAKGAGNINVFLPGQSYYLFTLFAKQTTTQTYQVYVGDGFDPNTDVWATQADVAGKPVKFTPPGTVTWPAGWEKAYANGVLTVTMRMNFQAFIDNYNGAFQGRCQPASFCTWTPSSGLPAGGTCGCTEGGLFTDLCKDTNSAGENVCAWAQKDIDCPKGGCYGIGFKIGSTFTYDPPTSPRPAPACYGKAGWDTTWTPASGGIAQSCTSAPTIPPQFCQ